MLLPLCLCAQQPVSDEAAEKQLREAIDKQIDEYTRTLGLEDWQVFYLDSILVHDYGAMNDELKGLTKAKVSNSDYYVLVQDKWMEKMYTATRKVLDEEQWAKYLKSGAARSKKARDKRESKRNKSN